jgi:hypothetical protein
MNSPKTCPLYVAALLPKNGSAIQGGYADCTRSNCAWWSETRQDCRRVPMAITPTMREYLLGNFAELERDADERTSPETKVDLHENFNALDQAADNRAESLSDPRD